MASRASSSFSIADSPSSGYAECASTSAGDHFETQCTFRRERQLVFGGLAIHQITRSARQISTRPIAPALLRSSPTTKSKAEIFHAFAQELLGGGDHGRNNALRVAGAASPDIFGVLARWKEGRDGVHVRRERHDGLAPGREDVEPPCLDVHALDAAAVRPRRASTDGRRDTTRPAIRCR